jgi:hypothetical protein
MSKLSLDALHVTSFETSEPDEGGVTTGPTIEDPLCYSPFCGPTAARNCSEEVEA